LLRFRCIEILQQPQSSSKYPRPYFKKNMDKAISCDDLCRIIVVHELALCIK